MGLNEYDFGKKQTASLIVNWKDKLFPVKLQDIVVFGIEYKMVQLVTFDNQKYFINQTMDELEEICGQHFFRVNRQCLVNKNAVKEAMQCHGRKLKVKLSIPFETEILVSKIRVSAFLEWLKS